MAQVWKLRVMPGAEPVAATSLGRIDLTQEEWLAFGALAGGLVSSLGIYFFATGRQKEAYAIGIAASVVSAVLGAARLMGGSS